METQYIESERAHVMCPNMHFGIFFTLRRRNELELQKDAAQQDYIQKCLNQLAMAHPFLRSTIQYEAGSQKLYYEVANDSKIELAFKKSAVSREYEEIGKKEWNVFEQGLLKVICILKNNTIDVLFAAHHLLGDGRSILTLVQEFASLYTSGKQPAYSEEHLIRGFKDLPQNIDLHGISRYLVNRANKQWRKEGKLLAYSDYLTFVKQFTDENPVSLEFGECKTVSQMRQQCRQHQVSINDLLMAKTYRITKKNKIIIASDIRDKISCYRKGTLGNYATAFSIVWKSKKQDIFENAKQIHNKVTQVRENPQKAMLVLACYLNMDKTLIDAAACAGLGGFHSKAAEFVGGSMFGFKARDGISITNLGAIQDPNIETAVFIPPASPAMKETIGVLTVNDTMKVCCSYYNNKTKKEQVKELVTALCS